MIMAIKLAEAQRGHSVSQQTVVNDAQSASSSKAHSASSANNGETIQIAGAALNVQFDIARMVIVDMSPHRYRREQGALQRSKSGDTTHSMPLDTILQLLNSLDLSVYSSVPLADARRSLDRQLAPKVSMRGLRAFLRTCLRETKQADGTRAVDWQFNLAAITRSADKLFSWPTDVAFDQLIERHVSFNRPIMFLGGSLSDMVDRTDLPQLRQVFPNCTMQFIEGAGHWVQADKPLAFADAVINFVDNGRLPHRTDTPATAV